MRKVLVFTSLYPNAVQPGHGVFVEYRTRRLVESGKVQVEVVAPVFLPPPPLDRHPAYRALCEVPAVEQRHGIAVHHPVVRFLPVVGWRFNPWMMARASLPLLRQIHVRFPFELIDSHYFYPDGVAAARLAGALDLPLVITARGSDVNLWPRRPAVRRMVLDAANAATGLGAVGQGLAGAMVKLGMDRDKIAILRNGVDFSVFSPQPREAAQARWGVSGFVVVSVGGLIMLKGHDLTIRAIARIPDATLLIAGKGVDRPRFEALAQELGVSDRVRFLGSVLHDDLASLYAAADVSVLASWHEGLPNVLLESIACGTPVVATATAGAPEVLDDPRAGVMIPVGDGEALHTALAGMRDQPPDRTAVCASAQRFDWAATTASQLAQFERVLAKAASV